MLYGVQHWTASVWWEWLPDVIELLLWSVTNKIKGPDYLSEGSICQVGWQYWFSHFPFTVQLMLPGHCSAALARLCALSAWPVCMYEYVPRKVYLVFLWLDLQLGHASRLVSCLWHGDCSQCLATSWFEFTLGWDSFLGQHIISHKIQPFGGIVNCF